MQAIKEARPEVPVIIYMAPDTHSKEGDQVLFYIALCLIASLLCLPHQSYASKYALLCCRIALLHLNTS